MKSPFQYGKIVSGSSFINRTKEVARLESNFTNKIHTVLISPRRWGKSSLVYHVAQKFKENSSYRVCFIDLFSIVNEADFYKEYARQILMSTGSRIEEWTRNAKKFLSRFVPRITVGQSGNEIFDLNLSYQDQEYDPKEILDLSEKVAQEKKITIVICIDEFQNIERFKNPLEFQQKLRSFWQKHQRVVYCLYGSKKHMLTVMFNKRSKPFFHFGDIMYLEKINPLEFEKFIKDSFRKRGIPAEEDVIKLIPEKVDNNPYYIQQLAYFCWTLCQNKLDNKILELAVDQLISTNQGLFQNEFDSLSPSQVQFMKLLADGIQENFTSDRNINQYRLGSSANVIRIIKSLLKKEMIEKKGNKITFIDPLFNLWLKRIFD